MDSDSIQKAGDVLVEQIVLTTSSNRVIDLNDFLVELNIYEDMFSNYLRGTVLLTDSRNLIEIGPIIGEEFLTISVRTPSFDRRIKKTFKIFKVSDRSIIRDNNTQMYTLHFVSIELYYDILLPLFVSFEGKITDVVSKLFTDYIVSNRDYDISGGETQTSVREIESETPLIILNDTANSVKFVATGWTPFRTINWLASKSIPLNETSKNFVFFESNKAFYFGSIEYLLKDVTQSDSYIGEYSISAANIRDGKDTPDINREYFIAKDVEMVETTDGIKNFTNGYLASRLITLDVYNKKYQAIDYDYTEQYRKQWHTSGSGHTSIPIFATNGLRNPFTHISYYPVNPKLFQNSASDHFKDNISEKMGDIYGNRRSSMLDLSNLKLHMTVPGRTDIEVGNILKFKYPGLGGKDESTSEEESIDKQYSGYYLITAIHHKINKITHFMTMECVKDSLYYDITTTNET